jgi:release factor glutamine methyltransferase
MRTGTVAPLHQVLHDARRALVASGIGADEAAVDVGLFARAILGWDEARLITEWSSPAPPELEPRFSNFVVRRAAREPAAYILESREFWGLDFRVTPAVLIPRPETEFVVEEALAVLAGTRPAAPRVRVADIGTGSGCIGVSLAHEAPACRVVATDVSLDALAVARQNARRHDVADRMRFVATAYLDGVSGRFDLLLANPPYVRDTDKPALARDVRYEPDVALFGGASGLRNIAGVLDTAIAALRAGGWLIMEFGFGQDDDVRALVDTRQQLRVVRIREDLQGIPRTAVIQHT